MSDLAHTLRSEGWQFVGKHETPHDSMTTLYMLRKTAEAKDHLGDDRY